MKNVLLTAFSALLAMVLLADPADAKTGKKGKHFKEPAGMVSAIRDDRIRESSGLALSAKYDDLVYTVNDRGNHPMVYAVRVSTGEVVGTADISDLDVEDTESISVDANGTLWLGDLGDNDHVRDNVSIISFPEPGPGTHRIGSAHRYGVTFPDGPVDVEGLLVRPNGDGIYLVSKNRTGPGTIFAVPTLKAGGTVTADDLRVEVPEAVTDATFTHNGARALLRTNDKVWIYDPTTWTRLTEVTTPDLRQGESVTVERGDRTVLVGSEGKNSPIVRVDLPARSTSTSTGANGGLTTIGVGVAGIAALGGAAMLGRRWFRAGSATRTA